jgi:hypothetical protein
VAGRWGFRAVARVQAGAPFPAQAPAGARPVARAGTGTGRRRGLWLALPLAASLAAVSCGDGGDPPPPPAPAVQDDEPFRMETVRFAQELDVDLAQMRQIGEGVYFRDVRQGRGTEAEVGQSVTVEYKAWLPDGTLFEQRPSPDGFGVSEFILGENSPVEGLNAAIPGMSPGGVRRIIIPPGQGYGLVGRPEGVPPHAPLVFEVRLLGVRPAPPPPEE